MAQARLFDPKSDQPFALSRTKVELFMDCPRCFYLDRRLGIGRPSGPPFNLNSAVDALLKREFDDYRAKGQPHPLMTEAGIKAVPHAHPQLETWRANFKGVRTLHELIPYDGNDSWVEKTLEQIRETLLADHPPAPAGGCEHCGYVARAGAVRETGDEMQATG